MNAQLPSLECDRLILRPFTLKDAPRVQELAGDRQLYETTLNVPHPYADGMAEKWIATHETDFQSGNGMNMAITLKDDGTIVGTIGLGINPQHRRAELGYWIGVPHWGQGYCTEAARCIIRYGFEVLGLHKITSSHFAGNPASGRVMVKAGMCMEGELVEHVCKDGRFHNLLVYGIIRT